MKKIPDATCAKPPTTLVACQPSRVSSSSVIQRFLKQTATSNGNISWLILITLTERIALYELVLLKHWFVCVCRGIQDDQDLISDFPPQFTMRLRDRRVQMTYPVRLTCQIAGRPTPELVWSKDGEELKQDGKNSQRTFTQFGPLGW